MNGDSEVTFDTSLPRHIIMERTLDAPRDRLYRAVISKHLIPNWWGPSSLSTTVERMDVKPGGKWRYVQHDSEGREYAFHGTYREVKPNEKLVYTFIYEGTPGDVMTEKVTFEDAEEGKTKMTVTDEFETPEQRDEMLRAGMKEGALESSERFARLVEPARVR